MKNEKIIININLPFNSNRKKNQRKRNIMYNDKETKNKTRKIMEIFIKQNQIEIKIKR
jgi:hypothetical protein